VGDGVEVGDGIADEVGVCVGLGVLVGVGVGEGTGVGVMLGSEPVCAVPVGVDAVVTGTPVCGSTNDSSMYFAAP
jgi:hypothetical protein